MSENEKMKPPPVKPTHDALFRAIIDDKDRAADLLRDYLPEQIRKSMGDEMPVRVEGSFVDEDAHLKHSDGSISIKVRNAT